MKQLPLVSIIIPMYNVEQYIERCIKSIMNQTYQTIEIIIIDDGSTDKSIEICNYIKSKFNKIILIKLQHVGAGYARNAGIEQAQGKYVLFVDSDDYLVATCIERLVYVAEYEQCDIVKFKWTAGYENEYSLVPYSKEYEIYNKYEAFRHRDVDISICGKFFKREIFRGIRYPQETIHDDEFITYKLIYVANKIVVLNEIYYYRYKSANSIMRKKRFDLPIDFIRAYKQRIEYFLEKNEDELVTISQKEYAIRLMIVYILYNDYEFCKYSKDEILELFRLNYEKGKQSASGIKEKLILGAFHTCPCIMPYCFRLIKKIKYLIRKSRK